MYQLLAALLLLLAPVGAEQAVSDQATILLSLPEACAENWEDATAGLPGAAWMAGTPPCGGGGAEPWRGVTCDAETASAVVKLKLGGVKIRCSGLPPQLALLPSLQLLDLKCNALVGTIPPAWRQPGAFPALQNLNLADNLLVGSLSDFSLPGSQLPATRVFNVSRNSLNRGPIPPAWHSSTLEVLDVSFNMVPGTMPASWAEPVAGQRSAFPSLYMLGVQGNNLTGTYAPWPGHGVDVFASNFTILSRPGNGLLEGVPRNPPLTAAAEGSGLSAGAIAGIVVGAVAGAALVAGLAAFVLVRRKQHRGVAAAAAASPDTSKNGRVWGSKDLEAGPGGSGSSGSDTAGGSAWSSLNNGCSAALPAGSRRDSAMGSRASSPEGEGTATDDDVLPSMPSGEPVSPSAGLSAGLSSGECSRGSSGPVVLSVGGSDTDTRRLPGEGSWSTVRFADLQLSHVLGHGSFGFVRLAKYFETSVAVKILGGEKKPEVADSVHTRHVISQLEKEAGIMRELRHPNVCQYIGACLDPPCLLMEHCSRRSLDKILTAGLRDPRVAKQLTWPRLLGMMLDAARGLLYLHTRSPPVYHRDFKSANLLVTASWQVKVADFNLSRIQEGGVMSSVCIQNPRWLSPERLAGGTGDLAADVWAFGTVMHELLTWEAPHGDQNAYQIIHTVQGAASGSGLAAPPPTQLPAGPLGQYGEYVALMAACWHRDPRQRPGMEEVASRLRAILAAELGRPLSVRSSISHGDSLPRPGSSFGPSTPAEPRRQAGTAEGAASGATDVPSSPFAAAAAGAAGTQGSSPFGAAAAAPPEGASPFAAAAALAPAASDAAAGPSPFAAAGAAAFRQDSVSPGQLTRQPTGPLPQAQAPQPPQFGDMTDSVLASFARMESVQRQLSRSVSNKETG